MKFDKLKEGMTLYDVGSTRMGNTTMRTISVWRVHVKEIDVTKRRALVSWNSNPAKWVSEYLIEKYKAKEPILVKSGLGYRRPTREELAEIRAKQKQEQSK